MKTLKILLWIIVIVHLSSFVWMFLPWDYFSTIAEPFGVEWLSESPVIAYSTRVMLTMMGIIGVLLIPIALNPKKYKIMIRIIGVSGILVAVFMFILSTFVYKFGNAWYYVDPFFALIFGAGILGLVKKV